MTGPGAVRTDVAGQVAALALRVIGGELPIRLRAWDGSEAGPADGPVLVVRDRTALRRLLWHPNELGVAQAYVAGEIEVEGDLTDALRRVRRRFPARADSRVRIRAGDVLRAAVVAVRLGIVGARPAPPAGEARLTGPEHSRERDLAVVSHHYDLSNRFYALILDPTMAYSCAYWRGLGPGYTLADAQRDKLALICRKLGLRRGMRLLDVGCGWGSLTMHAALHHGVRVTAVTLSEQQRAHVARRIGNWGLGDLVDVHLRDYRDLRGGPYDAIASVEMGEHVGAERYGDFATRLHGLLRPAGRLLVQQMSRSCGSPGGGRFIQTYIAADMHMRPVGETVDLLERAGFEVRDVQAMREHYVRTARAWLATIEQRWAEVVDLVGEPTARVWRLYLAGGALAFEHRRMGVDQILAVRPAADGSSGLPLDRAALDLSRPDPCRW
ncbi:SAM-dependent methyltransferase [Virgisporangium aurantiacum]|uniref:Cyclopropane-fatty-acyl-phospholipid synthase n=1 Tax=Virgisporangium aurantiacum TaxID=175570 RepID=A0A8J4E0S8_9ACTN|nr:cyclopropane-fatty-acyl-phospholipid synthase family protein [Virgisporangium aurantiacum]GIJ57131.1 cyclopropane-fatty-acyl-phospholipid synthase [Virgisporangium aurantiacum]